MRIRQRQLDKGLFLTEAADSVPEGFALRYRGISPLTKTFIISRDGSGNIYNATTIEAHSIFYFGGYWYIGEGTNLLRVEDEAIVETYSDVFDGNRLSFVVAPSTSGKADYLFVCGGGDPLKFDSSGDQTNWGIDPPVDALSLTAGAAGSLTGVYKYRCTFYNSTTGTRSNPSPSPESTISLLMRFDNNLTDATGAHTPVDHGTCTFDASVKKVGTHSVVMNGSSQYVTVPSHPAWVIESGHEWTAHVWFRADTLSSYPSCIFSVENCVILRILDNGSNTRIELIAPVPSVVINVTPTISLSTWYHIAVTRYDGKYYLYLNGAIQNPGGTAGAGWGDEGNDLYIGNDASIASTYFDGRLDEFVWVKDDVLWYSDFTPPTTTTEVVSSISLSSDTTDISDIPESEDAQVDYVELWRTIADGSVYFRLTVLANGTTTYNDSIEDSLLQSTQLPEDNAIPYEWFDDCAYHNASMFWITRTEDEALGRLYYSPIGRSEAVQGYVEVCSGDETTQRLLRYANILYVITTEQLYQVVGANPYTIQPIAGVVGTNNPHTCVVTPFGIMYEAHEGVRLYQGGAQSILFAHDAVKILFRGRSAGDLSSFTGLVATFARGEYIISDGDQSIAVDIQKGTWRDLGIGCTAFAYDKSNDVLAAGVGETSVVDLEKEGETDDNGTAIDFSFEPAHAKLEADENVLIQHVHIDANMNGEDVTATLILDGEEIGLGILNHTSREIQTININRWASRVGLRLTGSLSSQIEIHEIAYDIYDPTKGQ